MSRSGAAPALLLALVALLCAADLPAVAGHPCPTYPTIAKIWNVKNTVWFELKPPYTQEPTFYAIVGDPNTPGKPITISGPGAKRLNGNLRYSINPLAYSSGVAYVFEAYSLTSRCGESEHSPPKRFVMPTLLPGEARITRISYRARSLCTQLTARLFFGTGCANMIVTVKPPPRRSGSWQKLRVTCFPASCGYPCSCGSAAGQAYLEGDDVPACDRVFQGTAPSTIPGSDGMVRVNVPFVARDLDVKYICSVYAFNQAGKAPITFFGGSRSAAQSGTTTLAFGPPTKIPTIRTLSVTLQNKLTVVVQQQADVPKTIVVTVKPLDRSGPSLVKYGPGKLTAQGLEFHFGPSEGLLWSTKYEVTAAYYNGAYGSGYYLVGSASPSKRITTPVNPATLPSISEILMKDRRQCTELSWDQFYDGGCAELEVRVKRPALLTTDMPSGLYNLRCVPVSCALEDLEPAVGRRLAFSIIPPCERILEVSGYGSRGSDGRRVFRLPFTATIANQDYKCQVALRTGDAFGPYSEPAKPVTLPLGPPTSQGPSGAPTIETITADPAGRLAVKINTYITGGSYFMVGRPVDGEAGKEVRVPFSGTTGYVSASAYTPGTPYEFTVSYVTGEYGSAYFFIGVPSAPKAFTTPADGR
ncbi:hypothetical protein C2E20_6274 [Micractinium conductrix]|uniref:Fibronectin type-III domain-containing protein n=1 Tax=Micractinium conductrix TaxID=554055 RepID=A0A2P6V7W8_9CHLO|nr:hypothetical protein C2E20_6274 [Micractinium conductrix]|eukprot:PSC70184.1 hypothetical protein C2E20_6274 [Micractinium conductrix]